MKAVILDITGNEATAMTSGGDIIGIRNRDYDIGQEITLRKARGRSSAITTITGIAAAAAAVAIVTGGFTYLRPYGVVSLDVNPSIEYTINRFDRVLKVNGVNEDGESILAQIDTKSLINKNIENAIDDTIDRIEAEGYISDADENYVVLTANTDEEIHTETLLTSLEGQVKQRDNIEPISFNVSRDELDEAHKQGLSAGRKIMVDRLEEASDNNIDRDEWSKRSVRDMVREYDRLQGGGHEDMPKNNRREDMPNDNGVSVPDTEGRQQMQSPEPGEKPEAPDFQMDDKATDNAPGSVILETNPHEIDDAEKTMRNPGETEENRPQPNDPGEAPPDDRPDFRPDGGNAPMEQDMKNKQNVRGGQPMTTGPGGI